MDCEMCGKSVSTRKYNVSGTIMNLGMCCAKYGDDTSASTAGSPQTIEGNLAKRAARQAPSAAKNPYNQELFDLVEGFGRKIREARERKGWTKEQLGSKVSARVPQVTAIESGHLRPSDDLAKRIQRELGITLLEAMQTGPGTKLSGIASTPTRAMTIGDMLKEQLKKKDD